MMRHVPCLISIVIPVYNGENYIGGCLNFIFASKIDVPFEVIVVDDGSTDNTASVVQRFSCKYLKISNSGVAAARNVGIREAKGEIIFFFDADVKLKEETIKRFLGHFQEDQDAYIIQGRWDKKSPVPTFSSRFLLLKYAYNLKDLFKDKKRIEAATLETGCLAVKREVFDYFSGFNEDYKFSGGEEHELGVRVLHKYKIFYYSDIFVEHAFGNIFKMLKKIYRRTINYSMLLFESKDKDNFMDQHRNSVPTQDTVSVAIIFLLLCSCFLFALNIKLASVICAVLLLVYLLNISKFLLYLAGEENLLFAVTGAAADFIIMVPRLLGLFKAAYLFYFLKKRDYKV